MLNWNFFGKFDHAKIVEKHHSDQKVPANFKNKISKLAKKGLIRMEDGLTQCEDDMFYRSLLEAPDKK